ncbi:MAG: hypothetical protein K2L95_03225 [Alphaproteobacteria bacterium]|nr:hypothetical protein [Alphaproteobacteria bacterium]
MKQKLTAILTLPILLALPTGRGYAASLEVNIVEKCAYADSCTKYVGASYHKFGDKSTTTAPCTAGGSGYCWLWDGVCLGNGSGHDAYNVCSQNCANAGYDVMVYDMNNNYEWGCACFQSASFQEWRAVAGNSGYMRQYKPTYSSGSSGAGCTVTATTTDNYRCAAGYYGTATSDRTGCTVCPLNATCRGGNNSTFSCKDGFYINSTKTGCTKCPDSKTGGLGWDANGNGVAAVGGVDELSWCSIPAGTVLHDATGTFVITDDANDGCEYQTY